MLCKIKQLISERISILRCIERIVLRPDFESTWDKMDEQTKLQLIAELNAFNKDEFRRIAETSITKDLGEMSIRELRALARRRGIIGYMKINKAGILSELSKLEGLHYEET